MTGRTVGKEIERRTWFLHLMNWNRFRTNGAVDDAVLHEEDKTDSGKTISADVKGW